MSYDLLVASEKLLDLHAFRDELQAWPEVRSVEASADQLVVGIRLPTGQDAALLLAAPVRCEAEDLDERFFAHIRIPRWLTEITISTHAGVLGIEVARRLATSIAKTTKGAAFDPQEDGVFWPPRKLRSESPSVRTQKIDIVSLHWIVALPNDPPLRAPKAVEACGKFLDVIAKVQPAASPLRCGDYEPLQGKGGADFERGCRQIAEAERGGMIFFTAKPPYLGGAVDCAYPRPSLESPKHALSCVKFSVDVDASGLNEVHAEHALLIEFAKIADGLAAMYGAAFYLRGYERIRSQLWVPQGAESCPPLLGNGWIGIPPFPAWVVWMHAAYVNELRSKPALDFGDGFKHGAAFLFPKHPVGAARPRMSGVPDELLSRPGYVPYGAATRIPPYERFASNE